MSEALLKVENLTKSFPIFGGLLSREVASVKAVQGVSFEIKKGETLGLVGESGCGKSTLGRCLIRLIDSTSGKITFNGRDITHIEGEELRELRKKVQIIFQDPYSSLNPRWNVGKIISEPLKLNTTLSDKEILDKVFSLMKKVGLKEEWYWRYPHQFSGGQRQRIGIARALALNPEVIVCDEPVSALDVSIQAQVLNLLLDLQEEFNLTYIFISHDLGVVEHISDRIIVMYYGQIVESKDVESLFSTPEHPYTQTLLNAIPKIDLL